MAPGRRHAIWMSGSFPGVSVEPWVGDESSNITIKWWKWCLKNDQLGGKRQSDLSLAEYETTRPESAFSCCHSASEHKWVSKPEGWGFSSRSDYQTAGSLLPPVHSTERLREITVKKLREASSETLVEEQKPFTCTSISHLFITLDARVSPAAVNPSLIGAHYQPSLEDQL